MHELTFLLFIYNFPKKTIYRKKKFCSHNNKPKIITEEKKPTKPSDLSFESNLDVDQNLFNDKMYQIEQSGKHNQSTECKFNQA